MSFGGRSLHPVLLLAVVDTTTEALGLGGQHPDRGIAAGGPHWRARREVLFTVSGREDQLRQLRLQRGIPDDALLGGRFEGRHWRPRKPLAAAS